MPGSKNSSVDQAMFDIKPVDESGSLDVRKIENVQSVVNLASLRPKKKIPAPKFPALNPRDKSIAVASPSKQALPPVIGLPSKQEIKDQFDELMSHDLDLGVELTQIPSANLPNNWGDNFNRAKPRYRVIKSSPSRIEGPENDLYAPLISDIHHSATTISREEYTPSIQADDSIAGTDSLSDLVSGDLSPSAHTDVQSLFASATPIQLIGKNNPSLKSKQVRKWPRFKIPKVMLLVGIAVVVALVLIVLYGLNVKRKVVEQSAAAVTNLQTAHSDLKSLDFKNASQDFFSAYANFSKAGNTLNVLGSGITDILSALPGGSTLKSAKNLVQVGQLLSAAGTSMTTALDAVSKTTVLADPSNPQMPIGPIVTALRKALLSSKQQVAQASALMVDIDSNIIPPDKQEDFADLKSKLPDFEAGVNMSADYAKFFETLITNGKAKYLVMFQNGSELRPTGGFPGTYGVVSFNNGKMENIFVDDVYNLDGQIKQDIVPPLQMQHITPTWGMRDANWYVDFPTSARNIEAFYKKESGQSVDGVIVVNPEMIAKILEIVGPVEMPKYNLTLNSKNVLTTIQDQVEYGPNRTQPKQIVKDFAPLLLAKIYESGSDKWLTIFNTLVLSMNQRDVLMYFDNLSLESFATDKGFGGQVYQGAGDYLMATITNIKGSKTDAVTDTSMTVDTKFENDSAIHTVTISRKHNGGKEKYGFYNKQNPAYVRVLVPEGSELISVTGNDKPNFKPLVDYSKPNFVRDENLVKFETSGNTNKETGVVTYHEAGRDEFGFWLITDAGKSKSVTVQYRVPKVLKDKTYDFYIQKQPALKVKNFGFTMHKPSGLIPEASYPILAPSVDGSTAYNYSSPLENDLAIKIKFK
jgi:hypothetical protein